MRSVDNEPTTVKVFTQQRTGIKCYLNQCWPRLLKPSYFIGPQCMNSLSPRQNGRHFADDIFKCIFLNANVRISIKISLNFVPKGSINNIPSLVQIMAWRRPGDKPLSEPMMVSLLTHICVTRPQWVNRVHYSDVIMSAMASQITGVSKVCSTVCSGVAQRKHQSSDALVIFTLYLCVYPWVWNNALQIALPK